MTSFVLVQSKKESWINNGLIVIGASLLITLFGYLSIPLPFSPVPLATQSSFCLLLGLLLGKNKGALAVLLFLLEGSMGLPVFSLGKSGIAHLMGPTGGYLLGTLAGTYLAGALYERVKEKRSLSTFLALAAGNAIIFLCGWLQLSLYIGGKSALVLGVFPFLVGDFLKLVIATQASKLRV